MRLRGRGLLYIPSKDVSHTWTVNTLATCVLAFGLARCITFVTFVVRGCRVVTCDSAPRSMMCDM
jgi:hypothetical protein